LHKDDTKNSDAHTRSSVPNVEKHHLTTRVSLPSNRRK
jgi:hypothetical protein